MSIRFLRTTHLYVLIILFTALFMRVLALIYFRETYPVEPGLDEYDHIAINVLSGKGYSYDFYGLRASNPLRSFMPPLPALIVARFLHFQKPGLAMNLFQALLSISTCLLIYLIAAKISDEATGLLSGLMAAVYPVFVVQSVRSNTLTLSAFVLTLLIFCIIRLLELPNTANSAVVGALLGLGALNRPAILGLVIILLPWLWLNLRGTKLWYKPSAGILLFALLTVLPWTMRNYKIHHTIVPVSTNGGYNFWIGNNPFSTGSGWDVDIGKCRQYVKVPIRLVEETVHNNVGIVTYHDSDDKLYPYPLPNDVLSKIHRLTETELDSQLYAAGLEFIGNNPRQWFELVMDKMN